MHPRTRSQLALQSTLVLAGAMLALPTSADTLYVDPRGGDDLVGDGSAAAPWKTLTHTMSQLPPGPNTVQLAAGVFAETSGEVFPIFVPATYDIEFLGNPGGGSILRSATGIGRLRINIDDSPRPLEATTVRIRDLEFDGAGIEGSGATVGLTIDLARVDFHDTLHSGIWINSLFEASLQIVGRDCTFERCAEAVSILAGPLGTSSIRLHDSTIRDCTVGAYAEGFTAGPGSGNASVLLTRCEVRGCAVGTQAYGDPDGAGAALGAITAFDTVIAQNEVGFRGTDIANLELIRSTLAGNTVGVDAMGQDPTAVWVLSFSSVIWGNGFDLDPVNAILSIYSNLPPGISGTGVTNVDPLFVDAPGGDFHLRSDSPLIDAGDPSEAPNDLFESDLDPRLIDGDFNGAARVDMGYDEWNPVQLDLVGPPQIGASVTFKTSAPAVASYALLISLARAQEPLGAPGAILIGLGEAFVLATGPTPGNDVVAIPADVALVGLKLFTQGYVAGQGQAGLTNRVDLTIAP